MKSFQRTLVAAVLSANAFVATAEHVNVADGGDAHIPANKAKGGVKKLRDSGFLRPADSNRNTDRTRALKHGSSTKRPPAKTTRHEQTDDWNEEYFDHHSKSSSYDGKGGHYDDDYYYDHHDTSSSYDSGKGGHYDDDHYYGKGGKGSKGSKKGSKKGKGKGGMEYYDDDHYRSHDDHHDHHHTHDDDDHHVDDDDQGLINDDGFYEDTIIYDVSAFMDTRDIADPIFANPSEPDDFAAGNVNLYADTPLYDEFEFESSSLMGLVQGTCTRTDPLGPEDPGYVGAGFCSFTFEALSGHEIFASFSAEGVVMNQNDLDIKPLTITGGLGEFAGIRGEVVLYTATLDMSFNPPMPIYDPNLDFLSPIDGYFMQATIISDVIIDALEDDDEYPEEDEEAEE